jgi:WD40 repeat protein
VPTLAFGPEGKSLLSGGTDCLARLWKVDGLQPLSTWHGHEKTIYASAVHPNGQLGATACADGRIILWDLSKGQSKSRLEAGARVDRLVFSEEGRYLFASGRPGVLCYDLTRDLQRVDLPGQQGCTSGLSVQRGGKRMASATAAAHITLWDLPSGKVAEKLQAPAGCSILTVDFHPTEPLLAAGTRTGEILVWNLLTCRLVQTLSGHQGTLFELRFSPSGDTLASCGEDKLVCLWRVHSPFARKNRQL